MYASKNLIIVCLGAVLAASPVLASSTFAERDGSTDGVVSLTSYISADCSGDGQKYQAKGAQEVSLATKLMLNLVQMSIEGHTPGKEKKKKKEACLGRYGSMATANIFSS